MAFSSTEKINNSDKLVYQIIGTANDAPGAQFWYNEAFGWAPIVPPKRLWAEFDLIPGATNPTEADANVIANPTRMEKRKIRLTLRPESNNRAYLARQVYGNNLVPTYENWIQPALIQYLGGASNGYIVRLYHGDPDSGGVEISTTQHGGTDGSPAWAWHYSFGALLISTDQRTTFKTYYDTNGLWVVGYRYIGPTGGGGGDGELPYNDGPILMNVNFATGTSPPLGTVVHNQAEYDALGYDLKYPQDAVDILPPILKRFVQVNLVGSVQHGKPGNMGYDPYTGWLNLNGGCTMNSEDAFDEAYLLPGYDGLWTYPGTVLFTCASDTTIEAAQAGTVTNKDTVTRTSGTWTVNQHVGKFILITSGPGAGIKAPISQNSATVLYTPANLLTNGSVQFQIVEPGTTWAANDGAGSPVFLWPLFTRWRVIFQNIKFDTDIQWMHVSQGVILFEHCMMTGQYGVFHNDQFSDASETYYEWCSISSEDSRFYGGKLQITATTFFSSLPTGIPMLTVYEYSRVYLSAVDFAQLNASYANGTIINLVGGYIITDGGDSRIYGGGAMGANVFGIRAHSRDILGMNLEAAFDIRNLGSGVYLQTDGQWYLKGSNVNTGWWIIGGAKVVARSPASLVVNTTAINIDSVAHPYSDVGAVGDFLDGSQGSKFVRAS